MKRARVTTTSTVAIALLAMFFFLPLPISRIRDTGLMQLTRDATSRGKVTVPDNAILEELYVHNGEHVYDGKILARLRNPKLEAEINDAESSRKMYLTEAESTVRELNIAIDPEERRTLQGRRVTAKKMADQLAEKVKSLQDQVEALRELRAPVTGVVMGGPKKEDVGKLWERDQATPFCIIGDPAKLQVIVPVAPDDFRLLQDEVGKGKSLPVTMLVPGRGSNYLTGHVRRLPETNAKEVPIQLTHRGGGPLAVKPSGDPKVIEPQSQQYLVEIDLDQVDPYLVPGTLVKVKIHCDWKSCSWWVWRKISAMFDLGLI